MHENACKGLHESSENCWSFLWYVNLERQSTLAVFLRDKTIFDFFLKEGRGATFVTPVRVYRKCHISMYFLRMAASHFLPREKISCIRGKKKPSFQMIQEKSCARADPFGKTIFSESLKKISYFRAFFSERSPFIFRLRYKIIFSVQRNIIFSNNARKVIFQRYFLGKTIFSRRLEKGNMVFRAV